MQNVVLGRKALIGPRVDSTYLDQLPSLKKLNRLIGLKAVKDEVKRLCEKFLENAVREENGEPEMETMLNIQFLGNPGTGKTTVAKIIAEIYRDLNLISKGEIVLKTANELMGSAVGEAAKLVRFSSWCFSFSYVLIGFHQDFGCP